MKAMRKCSTCGEVKPLKEFYRDKRLTRKNSYGNECKECEAKYKHKHYLKQKANKRWGVCKECGAPLGNNNKSDLCKKCARAKKVGKNATHWKGGRIKTVQGYIKLHRPNHPCARNGYVPEHRLVMEKKMGRYLKPNELVHHINGKKDDNREENLLFIKPNKPHLSYNVCPRCNFKWGNR